MMPLDTQTYDIETERERLQDEMERMAERQAEYEAKGNDRQARELLREGNELDNQHETLGRLADEWNVDGVELAGLTVGEINLAEDVADENKEPRVRDTWVAAGTQEAPYLAHEPGNITKSDFEETVVNVMDLPMPYVRWAEGKIADLSHLGADMGNGYLALVRDKRAEE